MRKVLNKKNCLLQVCGRYKFECESSKICLSVAKRCDGNYDCHDKSDEKNCGKVFETKINYNLNLTLKFFK